MTQEPEAAPATPAPRKRGTRIVIIAVVILVVLGGIGAGAVWAIRRPAAAPESTKHAAPGDAGGVVSFEPFVVNLADQGGSRFLRVSVRLVVDTAEEAETIRKNDVALTRMRAVMLDVLTEQTADRLVTPEGKAALKVAIGEHIASVLKGTKVADVLFSDFVVQF